MASCTTWVSAPGWHSTLADANESRNWRIYSDFAQTLITTARQLYAGDTLGVDLDQSLYALDSTIIDLCLALFPWARFRRRKAAVKMHTLLDLRGNIPAFVHITDGKLQEAGIDAAGQVDHRGLKVDELDLYIRFNKSD